jgi:hypothetical protein
MLAGRLGDFTLLDVLRLLATTGKRGTLQVRGGSRHARLLLDAGHVTEASLTVADAAKEAAVTAQPVDVVFDLLLLDGGEFRFDGPADQPQPEAPRPPDPVVTEACARLERWPRLLARLGGEAGVPQLATPSRDEPITLTMAQWRLLARIDGHRTVATLLAGSAEGRWATVAMLDALLDEGVVAIATNGAVPRPPHPTSSAPVALQPPAAGVGPVRHSPPVGVPDDRPRVDLAMPTVDADELDRLIRGVERL